MVESQLRTNKVTDEAVLEAFLAVPRERFVPGRLRGSRLCRRGHPAGRRPLPDRADGAGAAAAARRDRAGRQRARDRLPRPAMRRRCCRGSRRSVVAVESDPRLAAQARARLAGAAASATSRCSKGRSRTGYPRRRALRRDPDRRRGRRDPRRDRATSLRRAAGSSPWLKPASGHGAGGADDARRGRLSSVPSSMPAVRCLPGFAPAPGFVF